MVVKNWDDDDMEFGPVKSSSAKNTSSKFKQKLSSGKYEEQQEDKVRDINHKTNVQNNISNNLRGDAAPPKVPKASRFSFYRGYKGPEDLVNFNDFFEAGTTSACKKCLT